MFLNKLKSPLPNPLPVWAGRGNQKPVERAPARLSGGALIEHDHGYLQGRENVSPLSSDEIGGEGRGEEAIREFHFNPNVRHPRHPFSTVPTGRTLFGTIFQPLRGRVVSGCRYATPTTGWRGNAPISAGRYATQLALIAVCIFLAIGASAQTTNDLSDAEIKGRALVQEILEQQPTGNSTNTGVLNIRGSHQHQEIPLTCKTIATPMAWQTIYEAQATNGLETLLVMHTAGRSNIYCYLPTNLPALNTSIPIFWDILGHAFPSNVVSGAALMSPFAGSEFCLGDLGLEFFHWPGQKVMKKDVHRSRGCTVLESTNPSPGTNGYSRIVSWIDNETLGIVEAYAYDAKGLLVKDFYPKDFKKVKGQWQVQTLVMENWATGASSRLEFDLTN